MSVWLWALGGLCAGVAAFFFVRAIEEWLDLWGYDDEDAEPY